MTHRQPSVSRIWRSCLLLLAAGLLAACGSSPATPSQPQEQTSSQPVPEGYVDTSKYRTSGPYSFCFSNASLANTWRVSMVEHIRYTVRQHPEIETFRETNANDDPAQQVKDIKTMLDKGCDVLIVSAAKQDEVTPATDEAMAQGVPVITVNRNISGDNYVSFVSANNCTMGRKQAEWLVEELGGKGDIVLLSGTRGASSAEDRLGCAREVFAEHAEIKEVAQAYVNWSPVESRKMMAQWLKEFDQIDGIWSDGQQSAGAVEAYVDAGKQVPPITSEGYNGFLKQWNEMGFSAVVFPYPVRMGSIAVETGLEIVAGKAVPHQLDVPNPMVTNENLSNYVRPDLPDSYWVDSDPEVVKRLFPMSQ